MRRRAEESKVKGLRLKVKAPLRRAAGPEQIAREAEKHEGDGDEEIGELVRVDDHGVDGRA